MTPETETPNPKDDIRYWQGLVDHAKNDRHRLDELWTLCQDMYTGLYVNPRDVTEHGDYVKTGLIKSTVDILFASTSKRRPKLLVHPNRLEDVGPARMAQSLVNHWWRRLGVHPQFRHAWLDTLLFGNGWLKTRWYEETEEREAPMPPEEDIEALASSAAAMSGALGEALPEAEFRAEVSKQMRGEPQTVVLASHPLVHRVSPFDMWLDPSSDSLDDANWVCQRVRKTLDEVHSDETYKKSVRMAVTPTAKDTLDVRSSGNRGGYYLSSDTYDLSRDVEVYEFWDIERRLFGVWADGGEEYLIKPSPWPFPDQPFEMMTLYRVPDEPYAMGEVQPLLSLEDEANATRTQILENRRNLAPKYMVAAKALSENNMAALASNRPGEVVELRTAHSSPREAIMPLQMQPIPYDLYNVVPMIRGDIDRLASLDDIQRGSDGEIRKSATEAAIRHRVSQSRSGEKAEIVEESATRIAGRMISMAQLFLRKPAVIRITGSDMEDDAAQFESIGDKKLASGEEFDFSVEVGSMAIRDDTAAREEALALFQTLSPLAGEVVNPAMMVTNLLAAFDVKEPEKWLVQQQPQQPQQTPQETPPPGGGSPAALTAVPAVHSEGQTEEDVALPPELTALG